MLWVFGHYNHFTLLVRGLTYSQNLTFVSVYYVAVRTIVLPRHGSNLARPVIIHDIIHGIIYVPSTPCCGFFGVSFYVQLKVSQTSHLIYVVL